MRNTKVLRYLALLVVGVCIATPFAAQQKGQYIPGQSGLNAGVMPSPGFTYSNITLNYSADVLNDGNGNKTPVTGSYDFWVVENAFYYVPNAKVLGGNLGFLVMTPTIANGSLTVPQFGASGGGAGVADTWVQPLTLGWHKSRIDFQTGFALMMPTGRYSAGADDNIGSGYWGYHFTSGSTLYLTKSKGTSASLFTDWEIHGQKRDTPITPGQAFTMEWGLGQVLRLDKQMTKLFQIGVIGYDQWQVTRNGGAIASQLPYYSAHAVGFQTSLAIPKKNLSFFFKYEPQYHTIATSQGRTIVFGGALSFAGPKSTPKP